jgi:hypothetical protein
MTNKRRVQLESGEGSMTEQEKDQGWHFCPDWDFMVIGPASPEVYVCCCEKRVRARGTSE